MSELHQELDKLRFELAVLTAELGIDFDAIANLTGLVKETKSIREEFNDIRNATEKIKKEAGKEIKKEEKKHKEDEKKAKKEKKKEDEKNMKEGEKAKKEEEKKAKKERKKKEKEEEAKKKGKEEKKPASTSPVVPPLSPRAIGPRPNVGEIWIYEKKNFEGKIWKLKGACANMQVVHSAPLYVGSFRLGADTTADVHNNPGHKGETKKFENRDVASLKEEFDHKFCSVRVYEKGHEPILSPRGSAANLLTPSESKKAIVADDPKKKAEEEAAAAKKKADDEAAAAKKKPDDEATTAKKKANDEVAVAIAASAVAAAASALAVEARKRAEEDFAAVEAKKKAVDDAASKKKAEEEEERANAEAKAAAETFKAAEATRIAEEERKAAEVAAAKKRADEARLVEEAKKKADDEAAAKQKADEEAAKKKADEDAKKKGATAAMAPVAFAAAPGSPTSNTVGKTAVRAAVAKSEAKAKAAPSSASASTVTHKPEAVHSPSPKLTVKPAAAAPSPAVSPAKEVAKPAASPKAADAKMPAGQQMKMDDSLNTNYMAIRKEKPSFNWILCGYDGPNLIKVVGQGNGSVKECCAALKDSECQYGYVRLEFQHDDTMRVKFVFFSWAGPAASALKKGKISVHKALVKSVFADFTVELAATNKDELSEENLINAVKRANY